MILLVDDDVVLLKTLRRGLQARGFELDTAVNGEEAFAKIFGGEYECMVLDMTMPGINGAELLLLMQAEGVKLPVIIISGFADYLEEELVEFANVRHYVAKPFIIDDLAELINECVGAGITAQ